MSLSVSPLGSLSSPSPSPSPPPNPIDESELSELTDDDQIDPLPDNDPHHHPPPRTRRPANPRQRQRQPIPFVAMPVPRTATPASSSRRKKRGIVPAPMWGWAYKGAASGSPSTPTPAHLPANATPRPMDPDSDPGSRPPSNPSATPDAEEEEEEELPTPPRAMEEEEGEEDHPLDRKHPHRKPLWRCPTPRRRVVVPMPFDRTKVPRSKRGIKLVSRTDMTLKNLWERGYKLYDPNASTSDEESDQNDNHVPSEDDDRTPSPLASDEDDMDVDDDPKDHVPASPTRATLNTILKPASPRSPSAIDDTGADNPSVPPSIRASLDPTASPPDQDARPGTIPDEDVDQDHYPDALDDDDRLPAQNGDVEADGDEDEDPQPEEPSQPPSPTPLAEPEPEPEPEDEDPDLQPAHRAEALDVLATIELKFALLRERVYVEKLEGLAWEEALVWDGTHPELHHLQSELTKRRDKRLMLASKKRTYEIETLTRKRCAEDAWCWEGWDIARTELQTEMIAETNRKRRKLERERRAVERPPGARRVPNAILNPPPAPTLRQIANTIPLPSHLSYLAANKKLSNATGLGVYPGLDGLSGMTAYPDLPTLSPHDIAADLEFLFQHRRMGWMRFGSPVGVPVGVGYSGTTSGFGPAAMGFGGPTPNPGYGVNGLGPAESYPPNPGPSIALGNNPSQIGGPPLSLGSSGPGLGPPPAPTSVPSQNTPNTIVGPGITNADGTSFSQPTMGIFQGPPSFGTGPTGYPLGPGVGGTSIVIGPGGTASTPVIGPGVARIQRPSGFVEREREFQRDRERELIHRDRDMRERDLPRDRELVAQREREMREREREREFGPNMGPAYPPWGSKPAGGMDWGVGDARRREEKNERDRERERSQVQPIVPTPPHPCNNTPASPLISRIRCTQISPILTNIPIILNTTILMSSTRTSIPSINTEHRTYHRTTISSGDGASPLPQGSGSAPGIQTMEIINLSANKSHWKRDEAKLGGSSMPGSRPSSTRPLPPSHNYDEREQERERERERERDRPIATPFVLAPSHHTISSTASSPRHGWTPGPGSPGPASSNVPPAPFSHPPERFHTPVPHRFSNPTPNGLSQLPRPLTTSPPRAPPTSVSTTSPLISAMNVPLPSSSSSTGPFPLPRKPSPALPKLGIPLGYSPRLTGPGVVPPTGPGIPGVLSAASGGPGVTPSGILTSGPGVPPGPGIAPAVVGGPPGETTPSLFTANRTTSPLIPYPGPPPVVSTQKVGIDGP
ncbi:Sds3-like-domain-containing protein [Boletus coccyginus]|nr:Sds3-like-domain-containing protein [Boletus coccyginus]